jgi:ubiquinone/menaquinone biosynthesis C-methylase UbiE
MKIIELLYNIYLGNYNMKNIQAEALTKKAYEDPNREWNRLVKKQEHILEFQTTLQYLEMFLPRRGRILDVGGGPGRYSIYLAKKGYRVSLLDLSPGHIEFAKKQAKREKVIDSFDEFIVGSMVDLSHFEDNTFDMVLCTGGPLSHIAGEKNRLKALKELKRVAKNNSYIFVSVMSRWGTLSTPYPKAHIETRRTKHVIELIRGEDTMWLSKYYTHYFTYDELLRFFSKVKALKVIKVVGLQGLTGTWFDKYLKEFQKDKKAWKNLMMMNEMVREIPSVVDSSRHILVVAKKTSKI